MLGETEDTKSKNMINDILHPNMENQGTFNENLRRSFGKNIITSMSQENKHKSIRRKIPQARLSGRIPLVNTSSEDEAEFKNRELQSQFLVRGSSIRSSVRKSFRQSSHASPIISITSPKKVSRTLGPSEHSSLNTISSVSSPLNSGKTNLVQENLEKKLEELQGRQQTHCDSAISGLGSLKTDQEEEISKSVFHTLNHWEERLAMEGQRHFDQLGSVVRKKDLEKSNFQLIFEQFNGEQNRLKKELDGLNEKLRKANLGKEQMEEQLMKQQKHPSPLTAEEEKITKEREDDLMNRLQSLTIKLQSQDQELAEVKEDNIVLRSQIRSLKNEKESKYGGRKNIFGWKKEIHSWYNKCEDPQSIRVKLRKVEQELSDQKEVNSQLKHYVREVLVNIMEENPKILVKG